MTAEQVFFVIPEGPKKKPPVLNEEGELVPAEEEPVDEEELKELLKPKFQKHIYPDSVIFMRGEDDYIRQFAKKLPASQNIKWDVDNLERRLHRYNECNDVELFIAANNAPDLGLPNAKKYMLPLTRFFQENKTEIFEVDFDGNQFEIFESMRVYVERNGRSYNYLSSVKSLNNKREDHLTQEESDEIKNKAELTAQEKAVEQKKHDQLVALAEGRLDFLNAHNEALKANEKLYMR